jgi:riboflavin biosynthesis pyrimidine reductase
VSDALELLYETDGLEVFPLPAALAEQYGGQLGIPEDSVFANFVATADGVVAIPELAGSNRLIAAASRADRFVMGLLRASCDAVVIGAGTLSGSPTSLWTPARAFPEAADAYALLRRQLGHDREPELAVVSARGLIDPEHPALADGAVVLTTERGRERLRQRVPAGVEFVVLEDVPHLDPHAILAALRARGHRRILSEGGPHALGPLVGARLVDELFLTISPLLLGHSGLQPRLSLIEGTDLLAEGGARAHLLGVRRNGDHLFLRYALGRI